MGFGPLPSGGIGGTTGTKDNVILRADGTGGGTLQAGGSNPPTYDDSGTFSVYVTNVDASNYSKLSVLAVSTDLYILAQNAGTGVAANIVIQPGIGKIVQINTGLVLNGTPTSDPHVNGQVWSNLGILTISSG